MERHLRQAHCSRRHTPIPAAKVEIMQSWTIELRLKIHPTTSVTDIQRHSIMMTRQIVIVFQVVA
jgi:hypothetical protein